jgi:hypothetical protein
VPAPRTVTYRGESYSIAALARHPDCQVRASALRDRLAAGWSAEAAVNTLPSVGGRPRNRRCEECGQSIPGARRQ